MYIAQTIELKPNKTTIQLFEMYFGYSRYIYNKALNIWNTEWDKHIETNKEHKRPTFISVKTACRHSREEWESKYSSIIEETASEDVSKAFNLFFKNVCNHPKFKSKKNCKNTFRYYRKNDRTIKIIDNNKLFLVRFPYKIKMKEKLRFPNGIIKECTISKKANRYYAGFVIEIHESNFPNLHPKKNDKSICGVDLGVKTLATIYDGSDFYEYESINKKLVKYYEKIEFYDKLLNRKRLANPGKWFDSKKYQKVKTKRQILFRKIVNIKQDYVHNLTKWLCENYKYIVIEMIKSNNLTKKKSKYSKKNHNLHKHISDSLFYTFRKQLEYKCELYNCVLIEADMFFPSTQMCSNCGHVFGKKNKLKLSDRKYICPDCEMIMDRDENASVNLRNYGMHEVGLQP